MSIDKKMNDELNQAVDLLAYLVCGDAKIEDGRVMHTHLGRGQEAIDASYLMGFDDETPKCAYTVSLDDGDRIFAADPNYLLRPAQDTIGKRTEIVLLDGDTAKWSCFRKLHKRPSHIWVAKPGADLYAYHTRHIRANGQSFYAKRVVAIDKKGLPVATAIEGVRDGRPGGGDYALTDGRLLVMAASIIEDVYRAGVFVVTVADECGVIFPVTQGKHLEVFKLRDGPNIGNRRRPLLHWVAKHIRKTGEKEVCVKDHLRGIHSFVIDGLQVELNGGAA